MKKIIFTILLMLSIFTQNTFAAENKSAEITKGSYGVQISFTLDNEAQAKDFITALNNVLETKEIDKTAAQNDDKAKAFSLETLKGFIKSDIFKNLGSKLLKIFIILAATIFAKRLIKMTTRLTMTKVDGGKRITKKQKQRVNTIMPIVDNMLDIVFFILVSLVILSELGIDIAPLLAGAGVIGLAIGFGAQTLVKDFITGFFILLEGTIAIGDTVNIGGIAGGVEDISIKSVVLRDLNGVVHTIPFSEVTTISNKTRDFAYHVFEVGVGYRENTDEVVKELDKIGKSMYKDKEVSELLLDDAIEIFGVDKLDDSAVVIKGRFKTKPGNQWGIGREFNRRVKLRFDELGIEIPYPHTTIYFGEDKQGKAPSANVKVEK